jgi:hypothetical protein
LRSRHPGSAARIIRANSSQLAHPKCVAFPPHSRIQRLFQRQLAGSLIAKSADTEDSIAQRSDPTMCRYSSSKA